MHGVIPSQEQDFALCVELGEVPICPFLQRDSEIDLNASPTIWSVSHSSNLLRMCVALSSRSFLKLLNSLAPVSSLEAHHW